jgi:hypothetical protein
LPNNVQVKKIPAYPIPAALVLANGPAQGKILKLTQTGFLIELATQFLQAGDKIEVTFETPVQHKTVKESCVVIKLYNQHRGSKEGGVQHIAEIHFKPLTHEGKTAITNFLNLLAAHSGNP